MLFIIPYSCLLYTQVDAWVTLRSICPPDDAIILGNVPFPTGTGSPKVSPDAVDHWSKPVPLWTFLTITKMGLDLEWRSSSCSRALLGVLWRNRSHLKTNIWKLPDQILAVTHSYVHSLSKHLLSTCCVPQTLIERLLCARCSYTIQEVTVNKIQISLCQMNYNFKLRAFSGLPYACLLSHTKATSLSSGSARMHHFAHDFRAAFCLSHFPMRTWSVMHGVRRFLHGWRDVIFLPGIRTIELMKQLGFSFQWLVYL